MIIINNFTVHNSQLNFTNDVHTSGSKIGRNFIATIYWGSLVCINNIESGVAWMFVEWKEASQSEEWDCLNVCRVKGGVTEWRVRLHAMFIKWKEASQSEEWGCMQCLSSERRRHRVKSEVACNVWQVKGGVTEWRVKETLAQIIQSII